MVRSHVLVCGGTGCTSSDSPKIIDALEKELSKQGIADEVKVVRTGCFGLCALGPEHISRGMLTHGGWEDIPEIVSTFTKGASLPVCYQETVDRPNNLNDTDFKRGSTPFNWGYQSRMIQNTLTAIRLCRA